jgi:hypothetical protein
MTLLIMFRVPLKTTAYDPTVKTMITARKTPYSAIVCPSVRIRNMRNRAIMRPELPPLFVHAAGEGFGAERETELGIPLRLFVLRLRCVYAHHANKPPPSVSWRSRAAAFARVQNRVVGPRSKSLDKVIPLRIHPLKGIYGGDSPFLGDSPWITWVTAERDNRAAPGSRSQP